MKDKYAFDRIICFEPSAHCISDLNHYSSHDKRIEICNFGLSNRNEKVQLHKPGTLGGSIYLDDIEDKDLNANTEKIELIDAKEWFSANIDIDDFVVVKTNCEGSEIDIIESLLDGNHMSYIYSFLITFDIRNYQEHQYKELEIRKRLRQEGLHNYCFSDDVMIGLSHEKRIENWLQLFGVDNGNQDINTLKNLYKSSFIKYSSKSGALPRMEIRLKRFLNYESYPLPVKNLLRFIKNILRLNREREI